MIDDTVLISENFPEVLNSFSALRNINSEDLIEKTQEEWEKLGIKQVKFNKWIILIKNIFPDIKKGDKLLFIVYENQRSEFFLNGKTIGEISDITFGKSFLRILGSRFTLKSLGCRCSSGVEQLIRNQ